MRGYGRVYRRGKRWWHDYTIGGKRHREPTDARTANEARSLLRSRIGDREVGRLIGRPDHVTLADLRAQLEQRYALKGNRSLRRAKQAFVNLDRLFGAKRPVSEMTQDAVNRYLEQRVAEDAARATANYEVGILISAWNAAVDNRLLSVRAIIKLPRVRNARSGFFSEGDFAALFLELPANVRPVVQFLHATGWRLNEALSLTWDRVDWEGQVIRIGGDQTKGGDDRVFPFGMAPALKALLEGQYAVRNGLFVFHRGGKRIVTFIKTWRSACVRAGLAGRLVHDLRRTAARNFRRAGVDEGTIMKLCGWKTRSMFDRYNVIDEIDLAEAVAKRARFSGTTTAQIDSTTQSEPSVSPSSTG